MNLKGKHVAVTGADGFIGSHLVENLIDRGCKVRALACYNSFNSWGWLDSLPKDKLAAIEVITGDVRDPNGMRSFCKGADVVFHLAALIGIPYSYTSPDNYVDTNIKGTLNIVQAVRDFNIERLLVTSTSEVYGTARTVPIQETHPRQPQSPYSATKIGADSIAESYYLSFETPVTIVRPFNTYGPRQSARAIIPTIITQLLNGKTEIQLGSLTPTRDMVFVKDTAEGFARIAETDKLIGEDVNMATGKEVSVGDMANMLISIINPQAKIAEDKQRLRPENSEVNRLLGCVEKLKFYTNWSPGIELEDGLKETIKWFSVPDNLKAYKHDIYNI